MWTLPIIEADPHGALQGGWLDVILLFLLLRSAGSKLASQADYAGQRVSIPHADFSALSDHHFYQPLNQRPGQH